MRLTNGAFAKCSTTSPIQNEFLRSGHSGSLEDSIHHCLAMIKISPRPELLPMQFPGLHTLTNLGTSAGRALRYSGICRVMHGCAAELRVTTGLRFVLW